MKVKSFIAVILVGLCSVLFAQGNQEKLTNDLKVKVGGDIQFHARQFFSDESSDENGDFFLRRSRLKLTGNYSDYFSFRALVNFANSSVNLQDSYLDFMPSSYLQFRFGKFKAPIGLELLQSPGNLAFIERSLVTNLVPNRDLGMMVFGDVSNIIEYQLGVMNGIVDGQNGEGEDDKNKEFVARVMISPFASTDIQLLKKLDVGMAFSGGKRDGDTSESLLASYKTSGRNKFFSYADGSNSYTSVAYADGSKRRYVPQFSLYEGRLGLLGEYAITTEEISVVGSTGTLHNEFTNKAFHLTALFMLTDDKSSYGKVKPASELDPNSGKWGAVQVVARFVSVDIDDDIFPFFASRKYSAESAKCYGIGVNWYLNRYFKISFNYEKTVFDSGFAGEDLDDEDVLLMQTQVVF